MAFASARAMCKSRNRYQIWFHDLTGADYIGTYIKPLAVIVDGSFIEDRPFLDGIKDQMIDSPRIPLIELPTRAESRFSWMSHLDATALAGKLSH